MFVQLILIMRIDIEMRLMYLFDQDHRIEYQWMVIDDRAIEENLYGIVTKNNSNEELKFYYRDF